MSALAALAGAALLLSEPAPMHLGEPTPTDVGVSIPIAAPVAALKRIERHPGQNRLVLFVPGVTAAGSHRSFADGPLAALKVTPAELGVALTLVFRAGAPLLPEHVEVATTAPAAIRLTLPDLAPPPLTAVEPPPAVVALAPPHAAPTPPAPFAAPKESAVPSAAIAGLVVLGLAALAFWLKANRCRDSGDASIQVLASRAIGPKQRLVMVDTGGERFLLATSDKEIHLLSALTADSAFATEPAASPRFTADLADAATALAANADLGGLIRLRDRTPRAPEARA
ncbi:MAG: flagellar biosynthetic protein FliO [Deltaproteobacteria bacterium]|nr:flagellar biosynthetic protein FliO [Deltaproteobacteria bacterium]